MLSRSYKNALIGAIVLHLTILIALFVEPSSNNPPVLELTDHPDMVQSQASQSVPQPEPIKATSVDAAEVMKTMNQIKAQREQQQAAEKMRQLQLQKQMEMARKERIQEQQRIQQLKKEAEKIAIAHKKQLEDEKKRLEKIAQQKKEEEKHLAEMKKQQQQEADKLAALKKKQELAKAEAAKAEAAKVAAKHEAEVKRQNDAKAREIAEKNRQNALKQAAENAERNARIAGEVDRYKALIISAISRQWILPENVENNLSSQFRIRLAPDGSVLEVTLTKSSGDSILDHSAQSAIYKASPLPVPTDPEAFNTFRDISLTVRPENARG